MAYKNIREITPSVMRCGIGLCPAIYEGVEEVTPAVNRCIIGSCPSTYKATIKGRQVYLIIGRQVTPTDAGLEKKVGDGEALIEVPKALIDNRGE